MNTSPRRVFSRLRCVRDVSVFLGLATVGVLACGGDELVIPPVPPPPPTPVATTVEVAPSSATLGAVGETVQLTATVRDQNGNTMASAAVTWATGDGAVATVSAAGLVTATGEGTTTITASSGDASGSSTVMVEVRAASVVVDPAALNFTAIGEEWSLSAMAMDAAGNVLEDAIISWSSADAGVATVDDAGTVTAVSSGMTTIMAMADDASGSADVVVAAGAAPATGPDAPAHAADSVISLFSDAYDDVMVDTWSAEWDDAHLTDTEIAGDPAKLYTNLTFAGIEFTSATVDASAMTHLRMDIWTPDETTDAAFKVKLVDFGADGAWSGGDDSEHEVTLTAASGLVTGEWIHLDLSLDGFGDLQSREHLAQLIISGDPNTVYVDNVFFVVRPITAPTAPAPAPTEHVDSVISMFSDAFMDVMVDTWSTDWDQADVEDVDVMGDAVKKYTNLTFAGIETVSQTLDISNSTHFRMDVWTPDSTDPPAELAVKLVDFGADGAWSGGDDSEHEVIITMDDGLMTGEWVQLDLAIADMTGLMGREHFAQLIIRSTMNTLFVDNVYFRGGAAPPPPEMPSTPAPTPAHSADETISLFSDAYDDVMVDTWSTDWDQADVEDVDVMGDAVKKYTNLTFAGIETVSQTLDISNSTHFRMDVWTPDSTDPPAELAVKLVDFGADGAWSGGDDSEHEVIITMDDGLMTGEWVQLDLAIADMTGLMGREHFAQLIIRSTMNTLFVDNVYFRGGAAPPPPEMPSTPAPTPTNPAENTISLFSDAYDDITVDTWSTDWDQADVEDVDVMGDAVKKYTNLVFAGIEFFASDGALDATEMTRFHMDVWTPDETTDAAFKVKLVDFGADGAWSGGDDSEHELTFTASSDPMMATGQWVSIDVPLSAFENMTARASLAQLIIAGDPNTVFVDNVYFYTPPSSMPGEAAPTPAHSADDVISIFSDAYDDITVDTWSTDWDQADVEDVEIDGNATKKYTNLVFAGIEFFASAGALDATEMTHFHMDVWTPDETTDAAFKVKLVDFGADGAWSGGDDSEHELTFTAASDPMMATGQWVSIDVPLSAFENMTARASLAQLIISGDPNTVYVDNVYLWK